MQQALLYTMSGISPFLDICQSETFTAKAIMGKTDTLHSTISTVFFRENYTSAEIVQKKKKADIFAHRFNGF